MIQVPRMVLVGAAARNVGKTELAAALVRHLGARGEVVGVKVTTIHERQGGACPRGGAGCGACALDAPWELSLECLPPSGLAHKDTHRLLVAGAHQVWWLRVHEAHLEEGARALLEVLPLDTAVVAESNSLRRVVEPGVFAMVRAAGAAALKPSAAAVWEHADVVVTSDGQRFDVEPASFALVEGRLTVEREVGAVVLAGGGSRRMGRDKARVEVGGETLLARVTRQIRPHVREVRLSGEPERLAWAGLPVVPDREPGQGPLSAIATCLAASRQEAVLFVPVDQAEIPPLLVARMLRAARADVDAVISVAPDGRGEPLFAVYKRSALPVLEALAASGVRRIVRAWPSLRVARVPWHDALHSLNTPEELARWQEIA